MSEFSWDQWPVTITTEDTQTSAGAAIEKEYTVPAGYKWLITGYRFTCSAAKATTVKLWKEAANTNLIEEWYTGSPTANANYSSRGLLAAANMHSWVDLEVPAGGTIQFAMAADGAGQTMKTQVMYKVAPA